MERFNETSPEVLTECLLTVMDAANRGGVVDRELALDCIVSSTNTSAAFICKKAGCKLAIEDGVLFGTNNCELVVIGEKEIPVSLQ
jgi:hypothetical protein